MPDLKELFSLKGRLALVTGAAGYVGRVIADGLAELGADVILHDRELSACQALSRQIEERRGVLCRPIAHDLEHLAEAGEREHIAELFLADDKSLDVLVNCASFVGTTKLTGWNVPFSEQSASTWRRAIDVNLTAPFVLTQALLPALRESGHGSVINIASIYGLLGPDLSLYEGTNMNNAAAYGASKAGLLQLTRHMATVLAPAVRVNAVTPGGILRGQPQSFVERYESRTPLGRMATEEDMKGAVAFLACDAASYVTGQNICVDGGWSAW